MGVKTVLGVKKKNKKKKKKKTNPNKNLDKNQTHTLGPRLQKKDIPAEAEAPLMTERMVKAPPQARAETDPDHQPPPPTSSTAFQLQTHQRGAKTRLFLPQRDKDGGGGAKRQTEGLRLLLEKYWQCGDKSHHNEKRRTLFNSITT